MTLLKPSKGLLTGIALCVALSLMLWLVAGLPWNAKLHLSSLTLAIVAGMALGNGVRPEVLARFHPGLRFCQQKLLRLGIVLYGIRLTLGDLARLGPRALMLDVFVIATVLMVGYWAGTRIFGLDGDTALLVSAGSGICGAAAVLAMDRVIESKPHKVGIAVATVVVFGTISMFLYPLLYPISGLTQRQFGVYAGATVHEVAQVVAAGRAVSQASADTAVVTKMLRVLLLAPVLLLVGRLRLRANGTGAGRVTFPWFVLWFGAVIVAQSFIRLPAAVKSPLINLDTVLLSSAMFALGTGTHWQQVKRAGTRPLLLAAAIFVGLVSGGWAITRWLVA
ncbi:MAG TPA: YeiH family protein [Bryobacteraceae bacterium]|nr:YeiH family protein [Bryobacteraceae bacterium]